METETMTRIDRLLDEAPHVADNEVKPTGRTIGTRYELRFRSLFRPGRGWAFPCDSAGHVDMDSMNERTRNNYMFARALIGIEVATPCVETVH